ncbi:protein kinase [Streptomyces sp. NPDC046909]|uniref:serine/threonine-protein kinase n=1 Tax=Streptomyces sp. NPDC046909 TaxID=3155617 RepID=UPI0033DE4237
MEPMAADDPRRVDKYDLIGRLGQGGMGTVFLGRSPGGRLVAVKIVRDELARDGEFRRRFRREVAAMRRVGGFWTAAVVAADPDATAPWLATEYVPGPSLAVAVRQHGPLPPACVHAIAAGLAEALLAIHASGLVHRDLKPSNVLLTSDGPRVIDFGIARALDGTALTGSGQVIGTPGFLAPEQITGERAGPPSDIFCCGLTLAYAATGRSVYGTGNALALLYRIAHEAPDLSGLPDALRPTVEPCLIRLPEARPTAGQLLERLGSGVPKGAWLPGPVTVLIRRHVEEATAARGVSEGQQGAAPLVPREEGSLLGVLLVAREPMTADELAAILGWPISRVMEERAQAGGLVDGAHALCLTSDGHAEAMRTVSAGCREASLGRLLLWAGRFARDGWPDDTPAYVVRQYANHLGESAGASALAELPCPQWLKLKEKHHALSSLTSDLELAVETAARQDPPDWAHMVSASLIHATMVSTAGAAPPEAVALLAEAADPDRAAQHAALIAAPDDRASAYCQIAEVLCSADRRTDAAKAAELAHSALRSAPYSGRYDAWADVSTALMNTGQQEKAREAARRTLDSAKNASKWERDLAYVRAARVLVAANIKREAETIKDLVAADAGFTKDWLRQLTLKQVEAALTEQQAVPDAPVPHRPTAVPESTDTLAQIRRRVEAHVQGPPGRRILDLAQEALSLVALSCTEEAVLAMERAAALAVDTDPAVKAPQLPRLAMAYAKTGKEELARRTADEALAAARQLPPHAHETTEHLKSIATELAAAGFAAQAVEAARTIADERDREGAVAETASALARAALFDEAAEVARSLPAGYRAWEALVGVGRELLKAGRPARARMLLEPLLSVTAQAAEDERSADALMGLSQVLVGTGALDRARTVTSQALNQAAGTRHQRTVRLGEVVDTLAMLAEALAQAERHEEAAAAVSQALDTVRLMTTLGETEAAWYRVSASCRVAGALVRCGRMPQALAMSQEEPDAANKARILLAVARTLLETGATAQAMRLVPQVQAAAQSADGEWRTDLVLGDVIEILAANGQIDRILPLAQSARTPETRVSMLVKAARALGGAGQAANAAMAADQALTTVQEMRGSDRARALGSVGEAYARLGRTDQALACAEDALQADDTFGRHASFPAARALALAGRPDQAVTLALKLGLPHVSLNLSGIVEVLVEAGRLDQGLAIVHQMPPQGPDKARWLARIARRLSDAGQQTRGVEILEQSLSAMRTAGRNTFFQTLPAVLSTLLATDQRNQSVQVAEAVLATETWLTEREDPV